MAASACEYGAPATAEGNAAGEVMVSRPSVAVSEKDWLATCSVESVTETAKLQAPGVVGVPAIVPVELRVRRGGRAPEVTCHE
jgi:hypothetical protein